MTTSGNSYGKLFLAQLPWAVVTLLSLGVLYGRMDSRLSSMSSTLAEVKQNQGQFVTRREADLLQALFEQRFRALENRAKPTPRAPSGEDY